MADGVDRPSPLFNPVILPGLHIPGNIFLAPLAGWTDPAFRTICLEHGASLTYTEMVSAEAVIRENARTLALLRRAPAERLLGFQIFVSNERSAALCVRRIARLHPSLIDLNCGCPAAKILKSGCGSALLRDPPLIERIVRAMCSETDAPVTVKLRSGWDADTINYQETAGRAVEAGASMVALHPRTRTQSFEGRSAWDHIERLKQRCPVPVVGSGDLFTAEDVVRMLRQTRCDAVMIGRGAMGNPFIFEDVLRLLRSESPAGAAPPDGTNVPPRTAETVLHTGLKQLAYAVSIFGERRACLEIRKHLSAYSKGLRGGAALRRRIVHAETPAEHREAVTLFLENHGRNQT